MKDRYFFASILKAVVPEYKDVSEHDIAFKYIEPDSIRDDIPVSKNLTNIDWHILSKSLILYIENTTIDEVLSKCYNIIEKEAAVSCYL